jgi:hypothetical protein
MTVMVIAIKVVFKISFFQTNSLALFLRSRSLSPLSLSFFALLIVQNHLAHVQCHLHWKDYLHPCVAKFQQ